MQTNKEFLDAMGIRSEDGFAAVEIRRVVAEMHRKPVFELETDTVGEPASNFALPWDALDFVYRLEKRLGVKIERSVEVGEIPEPWRDGPAVRMSLGEWMEIALHYFIEPIRAEIKPPENWTPLEPEGPLWDDTPPTLWQNVRCFLLLLCFLILPASAFLVSGIIGLLSCFGLCGEGLADGAKKIAGITVLVCWGLPVILFIAYGFLMRWFFEKPEPCSDETEPCCPQLLGTLTFRQGALGLSDDERGQGGFEILSGDYRFFLLYAEKGNDRPLYAVLTTQADPPEIDKLANLSFDGLDGTLPDDVRKVDVVIDSGLVGLCEASPDACWIPGPSRKVVAAIRQRTDGTVCGLKLYPTYGDGDYQIFAHRQAASCEIVLELVGPDEDEGRPSV